jgi:very-short-patch-repair endonuclease
MTDPFIRLLRRQMSFSEKHMWNRLRDRRFYGHKFRRQFQIGTYVVDFICLQKRVVIELDGPHHDSQKEYDRQRDEWLTRQNFVVLRFKNDDVLNAEDIVLKNILRVLEEKE